MPSPQPSKLFSHQIKEHLSDSLPSDATLVSRREFFASLVQDTVKSAALAGGAVAESSLLLIPAAVQKMQHGELARPKSERIKREEDLAKKVSDYVCTDVVRSLNGGGQLHLRGVQHLDPFLKKEDFVLPMRRDMQSADIILFESEDVFNSPKHVRVTTGYFAELRKEALALKKECYDIDVKHHPIQYERDVAYIAGAAGLGLFVTAISNNLRAQSVRLRRFLRIVGWSAASISMASPQMALQSAFGKGYPNADLGWVVDGRTVLMLDHAQNIAHANPGKKILVITGDMHAKGFEYYLDHPAILALKRAIYRNTYYQAFSGPPERITEVGIQPHKKQKSD